VVSAAVLQSSYPGVATLSSAAPQTMLLVQEYLYGAQALSVNPIMSELVVQEVQGMVSFCVPTVGALYFLGVGLYVAELNSTTSAWDDRAIFNTSDAARDDWLMLSSTAVYAPATTATTVQIPVVFPIHLPQPETIGSGEALALNLSMYNVGGGNIAAAMGVRARVSRPS